MLIKPIPRKLLIHSGVLKHLTGKDNFRKPTYGADINLTFVRVEPILRQKIVSSSENTDVSTDRLFYDCTNSRPKGVVFEKEDNFTFGGKSLTVREVKTHYGLDGVTPHHYEVECS